MNGANISGFSIDQFEDSTWLHVAGSPTNNTYREVFRENGTCEDIVADYLVIRGIVGSTLAAFGVIGNTLAIIVLSHQKMRCPTSLFLMCLAGYDNISLVTFLIEVVITFKTELFINMAFQPFLFSLQKIGQTGTVCVTLIIASERYIGITRPFSGMTFCDGRVPIYINVAVVLFSLAYNIPYYTFFKFVTYYEPKIDGTWIRPTLSAYWNSPFNNVYKFHVQLICMYILPWVAMLILNVLIIRTIWRRRRSDSLSRWYRSNRMDKRMTLAVLAVTTLFFIAYPFMAVLDNAIFPQELFVSQCHRSRNVSLFVRDLLIIINSATNFLFYCMFGKKFRQVFVIRFCPQTAQRFSSALSSRLNRLSARFSTSIVGRKSSTTAATTV